MYIRLRLLTESMRRQAIKALTERLQKTRSTLAPKTRFQFKSRLFNNRTENPASTSSSDALQPASEQRRAVRFSSTPVTITDSASPKPADEPAKDEKKDKQESEGGSNDSPTPAFPAQSQPTIRRPSFSHATAIAISNQTREHIVLPASAAQAASSGALTNLRSCVVDMWEPTTATAAEGQQQQQQRPFATLQVRDVRDSLLACGTVDGPAHVTGVTGSVIVVACRQFRMHECRDCDVYLRVGSRPIIEDCEGVRFAPLPEVYVWLLQSLSPSFSFEESTRLTSSFQEHLQPRVSPEQEQTDLWSQVDDFKWLRAEQSPHWSVLPEAERVTDIVWRDTVRDGSCEDVEKILQAVGAGRSAK